MKCSRHTLTASLAAHVSSQNQSLQGIPVANGLRACEGPRRAQSDRQDEKGKQTCRVWSCQFICGGGYRQKNPGITLNRFIRK